MFQAFKTEILKNPIAAQKKLHRRRNHSPFEHDLRALNWSCWRDYSYNATIAGTSPLQTANCRHGKLLIKISPFIIIRYTSGWWMRSEALRVHIRLENWFHKFNLSFQLWHVRSNPYPLGLINWNWMAGLALKLWASNVGSKEVAHLRRSFGANWSHLRSANIINSISISAAGRFLMKSSVNPLMRPWWNGLLMRFN